MQVGVTPEETAVLIRWKKRTDNYVLVRMKAEAILYASRGVDVSIIAEMVERSVKTIREWLAEWQDSRMCSVLTGHAGNQNAAKLTRAQKEELTAVLARPPSQAGVHAEFWDVPAIREVVKILFDVEYQADSSYQLLLRFCGLSLELPDPFDERRDEKAVTRRMAEATTQVNALLDAGWEVYAVDEVRLEYEAWTRRMQLPKGQHTKLSVDRKKTSQSFFGALSLTSKKVKLYPIEGNQNTEQTILALERLQRETEAEKIAVVLDNARFPMPRCWPASTGRVSCWSASCRSICRRTRPTTTRSSTSGTRPGTTSRPSSARPPKKPSARPPHTSPAEHSTTASSTSHSAKPETILFHDGHTPFF
ncbi:IS630 family transposase [Propionibacterium acidifaciens]|uniref:IS630 family transposase n=1 Tax=Propionibacterium acidifaciens TaxID=556499 RepID=UPI0009DD8928|nr:IS630 family transposase [Propionibacterium acidifaciens]